MKPMEAARIVANATPGFVINRIFSSPYEILPGLKLIQRFTFVLEVILHGSKTRRKFAIDLQHFRNQLAEPALYRRSGQPVRGSIGNAKTMFL
jgi:hypothetical protein